MEHDLRMREVQVNVEQDGGGEGGVPRSNRSHSVAMKALKLPQFSDEKDDLDAYLIRFERACAAFEIRPEFWSTQQDCYRESPWMFINVCQPKR